MELLLLYLWLKLDVFVTAIVVLAILFALFSLAGFLYEFSYEDEDNRYARHWKTAALLVAPLWLLIGLIPSTKDTAVLVAAHYSIKAADSPEAQKLVTLARKRANEWLDKELGASK